MKLHGICAAEGTVIGVDFNSGRFVSVESHDFTTPATTMNLRFSTPEELTAIGTREPRSVAEHLGIPLRMTPYGPARLFGPRPRVKPEIVTKRKAQDFINNFNRTYPGIVNG